MNRKLRGNLLLLLTATIWGFAFVAQSVGMEHLGPFSFNGTRNIIGALALVPVILFFDKQRAKALAPEDMPTAEEKKAQRKVLLKAGLWCGIFLFLASNMQQIGIQHTTVGKASFITAMYIIIVPLMGIFLKKKVRPILWLCILLSAVGLYFLCINEALVLSKGDLYILICAFLFAGHIMVINYFSPKADGIKISCIQFIVCGILSLIVGFIWESPELQYILMSWKPLLYTGILSSGVAYTLQIVAQKDTDPTIASLLLSLESVFGVIAGTLILHEMMSGREIVGCVLMFCAIILAQLPAKKKL